MQPFMSDVAFELGAVSQDPSLDLEIQFSDWKRRYNQGTAHEALDETVGTGMKIIDEQRTPKSTVERTSSSSTSSKKAPSSASASSEKKVEGTGAVASAGAKKANSASKASLQAKITQAMKHDTTTALELVNCLGRLAQPDWCQEAIQGYFQSRFSSEEEHEG